MAKRARYRYDDHMRVRDRPAVFVSQSLLCIYSKQMRVKGKHARKNERQKNWL